MPTIDLHDTAYEGRTSGQPWSGPRPPLECTRCGSSLTGRRVGVPRHSTRGIREVVETFKCGCGRRRNIRRKAAM